MRILLLSALLVSTPVSAEQFILHLGSEHAADGNHNEQNLGVGYIRNNWTVGFYENSRGDMSYYGGYHQRMWGGFSATLGAVTGYGQILPLPIVHYEIMQSRSISPMLTYAPTKNGGVLLLSLRFQ